MSLTELQHSISKAKPDKAEISISSVQSPAKICESKTKEKNMDDKIYSIPSEICGTGIPLGLGVAFSENLPAMVRFSNLPESRRAEIVARAESLSSDKDFSSLIEKI